MSFDPHIIYIWIFLFRYIDFNATKTIWIIKQVYLEIFGFTALFCA